MSLPLLLQLPQDALEHIAFHLEAPDLLSFLSSHRFLHENLGNKGAFWRNLLWQREGTSSSSSSSPFFCQPDDMPMQQQEEEEEEEEDHDGHATRALKEQFIRAAYCQRLSNVTWRAVHATRSTPSDREGHGCCLLGQDDNLLVVTGGFTNDQRIYIKDLSQKSGDEWHQIMPTLQLSPQQQQHPPHLLFAYGASLTRLNATSAVRFGGGFTSGGYAHETSLVAVLTITTNTCTTNDRFTATWKLVPQTFAATNDPERMALQARYGPLFLARAYHSATLLDHRYLFIVGGMKAQPGSVLDPVCLDCETWTWILYQNDCLRLIDVGGTVAATANSDGTNIVPTPTGRHGHSVVWDKYRNRVVLFGGGSGSDLLRSGRDNSEVWEFKNNNDTDTAAAAFPSSSSTSSTMIPPSPESFLAKIKLCQWRLIHQDQHQYSTSSNSTPGGNEEMNQGAVNDITMNANHEKNRLRPAETLNLGRCHAAHHVARDTVILLFGSGKPSTNSILAYDLQTDSFVRPKLASSATAVAARASNFILPSPRFTFGSVFIPRLGCIFVHGGYSTQYSQSIVDMALLNLTPAQLDDSKRQAAFGQAPHRSHEPVTDQHVLALYARDHHRQSRAHSLIRRLH